MISVSAVIPTYNRKSMIMRAVASACRQTYRVLEIIVVDDASTDGTYELFLQTVDPRIKYIRLPRNSGGAVARNVGIDASQCDYIAFLDSDDEWLPTKIETQMRDVMARPCEDVLLCCNAIVIRGPSRSLYNIRPPYANEDLSEYFLCHGQSFITSGLLLSTRIARKIRFDEDLRRHQDWDFILRLLEDGAAYSYVHEPLLNFEDSSDNRVSKAPTVEPTLLWFSKSRNLTPKAKLYLYFSQYFFKHLRRQPLAALAMAASLSTSDLGSARGMLKKVPRFLIKHLINVAMRP